MGKLCGKILEDRSLSMTESECVKQIRTYDKTHPKNECSKKKSLNDKAECYKETIAPQQSSILSSAFAWSVRLYDIFNLGTPVSGTGHVFGTRVAIGSSFGDTTTLWGASIGAERGTSQSNLKELHNLKGERTSGNVFIESIVRSPFSKGSSWAQIDRYSQGIGISSFCPASGEDTCWTALSVDKVTNYFGIQYQPSGSIWYGALSLDISTKVFLHLADDQTLRQYPHPSRDLGIFGFSFEIGQATAPLYLDKDKLPPPTGLDIFHETLKYILDDVAIGFNAPTTGNNLQTINETLSDVGIKSDTSGEQPKSSATTGVTPLKFLSSVTNGITGNAHLQFFDRLDASTQNTFFWGNAANAGVLLAISAATGSDTWLQGEISSLQQVGNLIPAWQKASPETTYWIRFALPQLMGAAGLLAPSAGKQEAFELTAADGIAGNALRKSDAITAHTFTLGVLQTHQHFDKGNTPPGERTEIAVDHQLKSGFSTHYAVTTPVLGLFNGNAGSFISNIANGLGATDGNGSAYAAGTDTLSTTVSSMVGWRGSIGDQFYGSASIFAGSVIDMGPSDTPQLGVGGRASVGVGVGFGDHFKYQAGIEAIGGGAIFSHHTDFDYGGAATFTIRE